MMLRNNQLPTDRRGAALSVLQLETEDVRPGGGPGVAPGLAGQTEGGRAGAVGQQNPGHVQLGGPAGLQQHQEDHREPEGPRGPHAEMITWRGRHI